jgi:hypothetical protein
MVQHLLTEHLSVVGEREVSTYMNMCERDVDDTKSDACLICLEEMSLSTLYDHLATHMEEIALFALPSTSDDVEHEHFEKIAQDFTGLEILTQDPSIAKGMEFLRLVNQHRQQPIPSYVAGAEEEHGASLEHSLDTNPSIGRPSVFPRISREFLDIETLEHYQVPWEWDHVSLFLHIIEQAISLLTLG